MKPLLLSFFMIFIASVSSAQETKPDEPGTQKQARQPEYQMKQYWFVMLTRGKNRTHDSTTAAEIQKGHMANITRLHAMGKIMVAGPFGDNGDWRGIFIMDCKDQKEAEELLQTDPAVKAGRLGYEIHPWWTAKNEVFK